MSGKKVDFEAELHNVEEELHDFEEELHDFEIEQSGVSRTLQMIVYPALVAFVILAGYGFYLVQSLTTDVHRLTETISKMNDTVHLNMSDISSNMRLMSGQMDMLVVNTADMSSNVATMSASTSRMSTDVNQMNVSTQNMAASTYNMQRDLWSMNKNVSKPFKMMSSFMPFGGSSTRPYVVSPPPTPYYLNQPQPSVANWPTAANPQAPKQIVSNTAGTVVQPGVASAKVSTSTTPVTVNSGAQAVQPVVDQPFAPAQKGKTDVSDEGHSFFGAQPVITNLVSAQ